MIMVAASEILGDSSVRAHSTSIAAPSMTTLHITRADVCVCQAAITPGWIRKERTVVPAKSMTKTGKRIRTPPLEKLTRLFDPFK
jgi:hypothetical protein